MTTPDSIDRFLGRKTCRACGESKPLDQFSRNHSDGTPHPRCKPCRARESRALRAGAQWETVWSGEASDMPPADQLAALVKQAAAGRCYEVRVLVDGHELEDEGAR